TYAKLFGQPGKAIAIGALTDHAALQVRIRTLKSGDGSQNKLVAFPRQQISDHLNLHRLRSRGASGRASQGKASGIGTVIDDLSTDCSARSDRQQLLDFVADANHLG